MLTQLSLYLLVGHFVESFVLLKHEEKAGEEEVINFVVELL